MKLHNIDPSKEVIITKLAESKPGLVEVGYWAKGFLIDGTLPAVGHSFWIDRVENSETTPERIRGVFNTSVVEQMIQTTYGVALITRNSVWLLENT